MQAIIGEHFPGVTIESFLRRLNDDPRCTFSAADEVLHYSVVVLAARPTESDLRGAVIFCASLPRPGSAR